MVELIYEEESYRIMGACFAVYQEMGVGFLEQVYQECLAIEFSEQQIPFVAQAAQELQYHGRLLQQRYVPDFICYNKIIVELKALKELANEHRAQVHNYLKATGFRLGLLVNFGHHPKVQWERVVR